VPEPETTRQAGKLIVALRVELVSPEQVLYEGDADMVIARTLEEGDVAFLTGHAPFLGALATWPIELILSDGARRRFAVHGGFVEVSHDRVTVLSDVAELSEYIDTERAAAARARCEDILARDPDDFVAQAALERANIRLEVAARA
jgi:F-type H+-transporting ATPase subunit epsilon